MTERQLHERLLRCFDFEDRVQEAQVAEFEGHASRGEVEDVMGEASECWVEFEKAANEYRRAAQKRLMSYRTRVAA